MIDRREDIAPNLDYELEQFRRRTGSVVTFSREARDAFLAFAISDAARWPGNFRDLNAAVVRLATLAPAGRITSDQVKAEVRHLQSAWSTMTRSRGLELVDRVFGDHGVDLDRFDRA